MRIKNEKKERKQMSKQIYNYSSDERLEDAKIIGGNPNGIISFNQTPHKWATSLYKSMLARTWFAEQVNISKDKNNYSKLSPEIKRAYDLYLAQLITNDSVQTNQLMDSINSYITSPVVNACLSKQAMEECLVPETEVLLESGEWKQVKDLAVGDRILAANNNMETYFTEVKHMSHYENVEYINKLEGAYFSQHITDNHRLPYMDRYNQLQIKHFKDIPRTDKLHVGDLICGIDGYRNTSGDKWEYNVLPVPIRLLIALQADGTIARSKTRYDESLGRHTTVRQYDTKYTTFHFSKKRKIKRFLSYLTMVGIVPRMRFESQDEMLPNRKPRSIFMFNWPENIPYSKVFYDVLDLSKFTKETAKQFIEEITFWDGWDDGKGTVGYDTTIKANADFVMAVATIAGYRTHCNIDVDDRSERFSDLYRVLISKDRLRSARGTVNVSREKYNGEVFCPTVEGGMLFIRHDNKVSLTGNSLHSFSYSIMAEDICQDTNRIYELWKHDEELALKNKAVADMYNVLYTGGEINNDDLLCAFAANQILEELVFPAGFAFFFTIEDQMVGSGEMLAEIQKDETLSHAPLFFQIFRTAVKESFGGVVPEHVVNKIHDMVKIMVVAEKRWARYAAAGVPGFTDTTIDALVESQANSVCKNLGIPTLYEVDQKANPLGKLLRDHLRGGEVETKTLFFEGNPVDYSKGSMDMDLSNL